jgi:peptide/nickel transport system ATP-binding protein
MSILQLDDLAIDYQTEAGTVRAVERGSFAVPRGEIVGLVGESGCGKTTLARAVTGVMARNATVSSGKILFEGRDLVTASAADKRNVLWREIAFVPQSAMNALDPVYRVSTQIREVLLDRGNYKRADVAPRIEALFRMVGLDPGRQHDYPHQFSGGMRQRVGIALALALDPKLLIADEPVTALDVIVQRQVLDTLRDLQKRLGVSVILVTHDISVVAYICDRVVVMYAGQVVEAGPVAEVLERPFHPYTMGLMNAFPDLARARDQLVPIPGNPPDLRYPPDGCRFADRCPFALPLCRSADPPLASVGGDHMASCCRTDVVAELRSKAREASVWAPLST